MATTRIMPFRGGKDRTESRVILPIFQAVISEPR